MSADLIATVDSLVGAQRQAEAARLLFAAAEEGDPRALAALAQWRIAGDIVRRDLAAARALLAGAGAGGHRDAALLHAYFLAAGTGGPDDWQAAVARLAGFAAQHPAGQLQLRMLEAMDLDRNGYPASPAATRQLADAPVVIAAENFATAAECAYLVKMAQAAFAPSMVVDPETRTLIPHPIRSSDGAMFGVYTEDLVINAINRRIAALSGTTLGEGEPLQLLRYGVGGEYRAHMDALPAEPNQRVVTVLIYLTDDYDGGETHFPRTGLSFKGRTGDALLFHNALPNGDADPMALHAGRPVTRGVKIIASRWIRAQRFTYPPPQPLLDL